jgi:hypothetical protein
MYVCSYLKAEKNPPESPFAKGGLSSVRFSKNGKY